MCWLEMNMRQEANEAFSEGIYDGSLYHLIWHGLQRYRSYLLLGFLIVPLKLTLLKWLGG